MGQEITDLIDSTIKLSIEKAKEEFAAMVDAKVKKAVMDAVQRMVPAEVQKAVSEINTQPDTLMESYFQQFMMRFVSNPSTVEVDIANAYDAAQYAVKKIKGDPRSNKLNITFKFSPQLAIRPKVIVEEIFGVKNPVFYMTREKILFKDLPLIY